MACAWALLNIWSGTVLLDLWSRWFGCISRFCGCLPRSVGGIRSSEHSLSHGLSAAECRAYGAPAAGFQTQPFRAGLTFSGRPLRALMGLSQRERCYPFASSHELGLKGL